MALSIDETLAGMRNSMKSPMSGGTGGGSGMKETRVIGALVLFALLFLVRPTIVYIEPGHVGIVIHRGSGGVDDTPVEGISPAITVAESAQASAAANIKRFILFFLCD